MSIKGKTSSRVPFLVSTINLIFPEAISNFGFPSPFHGAQRLPDEANLPLPLNSVVLAPNAGSQCCCEKLKRLTPSIVNCNPSSKLLTSNLI